MRVPAAWLAVPLLAGASTGIVLCDSAPERLILVTAFSGLLCAMAGAGFFTGPSRSAAQGQVDAVLLCVAAGCAMAGYSMGAATTRVLLVPPLLQWFEAASIESGTPIVLEGVLREDAGRLPYGVVLTLDVISAGPVGKPPEFVRGGVRLVVGGSPARADVSEWRAGRTLRLPASLRLPIAFADPGVPDERRALALRGIALTGTIKSATLVEVISRGGPLDELAAAARSRTRQVIDCHVGSIDPRSAAVATAILIGDRTGLPEEDERRLQDAGTYHVIAISGGNIAILTTLLVMAAWILRVPYRTGAGAAIAVLLFYGEIAGGSASVGRAISAAVIFLTALMMDHRGAPLNVLAVAAALAAGTRPVTTVDGGFLLSFGATTGIVLGVPLVLRWQPGRGALHALRTGVTGIVAATVCAEIALAPISASLFSRITFAGLLLNLVAIPLMTAVQCGSMGLLVAASLWAPAAEALGRFVHWSAWGLVESASLVDLAPWLARDVAPPSLWLCGAYYAVCLVIVALPRRRRASSLALVATGAILIAGVAPSNDAVPRLASGFLRVVVLDVGQGDSTLVVLPDRRALLIDAGGLAGTTFDMGARVVIPALRALGVRELHALVLTHGDPDHVGGAAEVLRRLEVANVWEGVPVPPHPDLRVLQALAASRRIVWRTLRPADVERAAGVEIRVHHPPEPDWERQRVRNDDSVVLELRHGDVSILLPGDIGREGEQAVIPRMWLPPLVVLKAAHHGSATSSSAAFLDATKPSAVIFSAGRNNRFGHPAPVVVERFARRGVEMFNTATEGAVFVETDGRTVDIWGWRTGRRQRFTADAAVQ